MPELGWYSSDDHVHLRRSPRENPLILRWMAAEDIHVGNLLQMGDFHTRYFTQYAFGAAGRYQEGGRLLSSGQEDPRTPEIGHTISLGAAEAVRVRPVDAYYAFDRTFDRVRTLGGVAGYAHQAMTFHGYRGMTLDVLRRKIDFVELLQFCAPGGPLITTHYYHYPRSRLSAHRARWLRLPLVRAEQGVWRCGGRGRAHRRRAFLHARRRAADVRRLAAWRQGRADVRHQRPDARTQSRRGLAGSDAGAA